MTHKIFEENCVVISFQICKKMFLLKPLLNKNEIIIISAVNFFNYTESAAKPSAVKKVFVAHWIKISKYFDIFLINMILCGLHNRIFFEKNLKFDRSPSKGCLLATSCSLHAIRIMLLLYYFKIPWQTQLPKGKEK